MSLSNTCLFAADTNMRRALARDLKCQIFALVSFPDLAE